MQAAKSWPRWPARQSRCAEFSIAISSRKMNPPALCTRRLRPRHDCGTVPNDAHVPREMRHIDVPEGNLAAPERFHMAIDFQSVGMEQGRSSRRLMSVQREPIEPHMQRPPPDME